MKDFFQLVPAKLESTIEDGAKEDENCTFNVSLTKSERELIESDKELAVQMLSSFDASKLLIQ